MWHLYILKCKDGVFYTGVTNNLERRLSEHEKGKGGYYTRYHPPQELVYCEIFKTELLAQEREFQIKRWSREKKLALIQNDF